MKLEAAQEMVVVQGQEAMEIAEGEFLYSTPERPSPTAPRTGRKRLWAVLQ